MIEEPCKFAESSQEQGIPYTGVPIAKSSQEILGTFLDDRASVEKKDQYWDKGTSGEIFVPVIKQN